MESFIQKIEKLDYYSSFITPFKFIYLNNKINELANIVGFPSDQLRYVLCLFAVYPLAFIYSRFIRSTSLKHIYSIINGILIAQFVLGTGWIHSFITSTITYSLILILPVRYAPFIVFLFNMTYLTFSHLYRIYVDYMGWTLDFTGPQMLLVIKLTSFAYNYYDGHIDYVEINSKIKNSPSLVKLYENRKLYSIKKLPSILEFYGYVYCFSTFLAGPAFEIKEYLDVTDGNKFKFNGKMNIQYGTIESLKKLLIGVFFLLLLVIYGSKYPISAIYSDFVYDLPFFKRIIFLYITLIFCKAKYYFAWKVSEGAAVLSGFGFEGFNKNDGTPNGWNGISNIDIFNFETAQSMREGSRAWNKGTQTWLERYVYARNGNSLSKTYFISAFWHGFYPGYYIFFLSISMVTHVNRMAYKRLRPWFLEKDGTFGIKKKIYDILSTIMAVGALCYFVLPFQALSLENSRKALANVNYVGHIILIIYYIIMPLIPVRKLEEKKA